ncbi:hypothetical protein LNTAR_08719 [Lentisphaera araneosa HTCC2155]|jgi:molybdopterin converting factor small subunit|uniref:ThiS family protein n=1 Tax=Lentisphaera araneosa HTCC2155 TaxID=313628 RepID=A6DHY5_9BACT|nr:MoaD/ThiS family protein [Lentisphaera araneosa]EDM28639.1 hypothetical protein LNTAR_08719 [Lentisphaera araneosa HTCC2155]
MNYKIKLWGQLKQKAGKEFIHMESIEELNIQDIVLRICEMEPSLSEVLLKSSSSIHPSILIFVNDNQYEHDKQSPIKKSDPITFMSPIAGG